MELHLLDTDATLELGRILAKAFACTPKPPVLLLQGDLGSGKTTLVRGFVTTLPGSEMAEVSSPSFNICNIYPTTPPVAHFDLYRLEGMEPDDTLFECFDDAEAITVVEWIEYLDRSLWPENALFLRWLPSETGRRVALHAMGEAANGILASLPLEYNTN